MWQGKSHEQPAEPAVSLQRLIYSNIIYVLCVVDSITATIRVFQLLPFFQIGYSKRRRASWSQQSLIWKIVEERVQPDVISYFYHDTF